MSGIGFDGYRNEVFEAAVSKIHDMAHEEIYEECLAVLGWWDSYEDFLHMLAVDEVDMNEMGQAIVDWLWDDDEVTHNSAPLSDSEAQGKIGDMVWLPDLNSLLEEFGSSLGEAIERGAGFIDVSIRCEMLGEVSSDLAKAMADEFMRDAGN